MGVNLSKKDLIKNRKFIPQNIENQANSVLIVLRMMDLHHF